MAGSNELKFALRSTPGTTLGRSAPTLPPGTGIVLLACSTIGLPAMYW